MSTSRLIVLTGPPGAGKTTVAQLLVNAMDQGVHIHSDDFWHFIRQGGISPWLPEAKAQNQVVMDALAASAVAYVTGGYDVLLDGIVGPWFIERFVRMTSESGTPLHYIVLRPSEEVALSRATDRGSGNLTDDDPVRHMYAQFQGLKGFEANALDSSQLTPVETAKAVHRGIEDGVFLIKGSLSSDHYVEPKENH